MGGDAALLLELAEHALDAVAVPIAAIFGMLGHLAVRSGRDDRQDASDQQAFVEAITIIALDRQQHLGMATGIAISGARQRCNRKPHRRSGRSRDVAAGVDLARKAAA